MDTYREEILEHWQNPLNFGQLKDFDYEVESVNPLCGDRIKIQVKIRAHSRSEVKTAPGVHSGSVISDIRFTGSGCAISVASSSILSEYIKGKSVKDLEKLTGNKVLDLIGGPVAPARLKCAFLPLEAIKKIGI